MSDNVTDIRRNPRTDIQPAKADPDVVKCLEGLLDAAKSGYLVGLHAIAVNKDDGILRVRVGQGPFYEVVGALEAQRFELLLEDAMRQDEG